MLTGFWDLTKFKQSNRVSSWSKYSAFEIFLPFNYIKFPSCVFLRSFKICQFSYVIQRHVIIVASFLCFVEFSYNSLLLLSGNCSDIIISSFQGITKFVNSLIHFLIDTFLMLREIEIVINSYCFWVESIQIFISQSQSFQRISRFINSRNIC